MKAHAGRKMGGPAGTAVEMVIDESDSVDQSATVACWLLHCPGQSVAWDDYLLGVIHLRPIEGVKPAALQFPGATHEVMLHACNPEHGPATPEDPRSWSMLTPVNVLEQVELPNDDSARTLAEECVHGVLQGWLWAEAPLSGQNEPWHTTLIKTSAHHRGEEHAP